jgi:hypothetical protein
MHVGSTQVTSVVLLRAHTSYDMHSSTRTISQAVYNYKNAGHWPCVSELDCSAVAGLDLHAVDVVATIKSVIGI